MHGNRTSQADIDNISPVLHRVPDSRGNILVILVAAVRTHAQAHQPHVGNPINTHPVIPCRTNDSRHVRSMLVRRHRGIAVETIFDIIQVIPHALPPVRLISPEFTIIASLESRQKRVPQIQHLLPVILGRIFPTIKIIFKRLLIRRVLQLLAQGDKMLLAQLHAGIHFFQLPIEPVHTFRISLHVYISVISISQFGYFGQFIHVITIKSPIFLR